LRPAFSNLIVGYFPIEGSISARKLPKQDFTESQTFNAPEALDEFQPIEAHPEQRRESL
jgi:hypothetical protein